MFLRKFQLPNETMVVDSHEAKWGLYVPGTKIKILPPTRLFEGDLKWIVATTSWRAADIAKEIVLDNIPCRALLKFVDGVFVEVPLGKE
jgi:hypothetical protein